MPDKVKTKGSRRIVARVAVTGALLALPMAALAGPALADTLPGVTQADQNWQHNNNGNNWQHNNGDHRGDRDDHRGDNNHWNPPAPPPPWFNGGPAAPQFPGGMFGSS